MVISAESILGTIVEGKVSRITAFGAFVDLGDGASGLIHISEVANAYVRDVNEYLKVGDTVKVKVISIDAGGKISLSLKQAVEKEKPASNLCEWQYTPPAPQAEASSCFEDKLARFMKDSNEKLVALKRHQDGRKGR